MKSIYILLFTAFTFSLSAQDIEGCDGIRYVDFIFDDVKVTKDIRFGEGPRFPSETNQELFFDVYEPEGDDLTTRPVMVLAFGGSFIEGTKEDIDWLCEAFARKGYVAVSIDYRLFDGLLFPPPNATQMKNVVVRAMSDMKAVIRQLRQDADNDNTFGINPDVIYAGGISAGSILACHVAAVDTTDNLPDDLRGFIDSTGGIEGNTNDITGYTSEVAGIINYSGGLNDADWYDAGDPPIYSVHDEADGVVPFGSGFAVVFGFPIIAVDGSQIINGKMTIESTSEISKIAIHDMSGKLIRTHQSTNVIDMSQLNAGMYSLSIIDTNGSYISRRVIVN